MFKELKNEVVFLCIYLRPKNYFMKYLMVAAIGLTLASCGGWSKGQENAFLDSCKKSNSYDCDCTLKVVKEKYPNASDFNKKGGKDLELAQTINKKCSK
jgi:hypothetical protein